MNFYLHRYKRYGHILDPKFKPKKSIRINSLRAPKNIIKRLKEKEIILKKISWLKNGFIVDSDFSISGTTEHILGYFYIQELASQYVSEVLNPNSKDLVLDMCAAPGSKTTHLSEIMKNEGSIIALDNHPKRINALKSNLERMFVKNVTVYLKDAKFANDLNLKFDKILLDAPCSGNYTLEEDWFEKREIDDFKKMQREQKKLIASAILCLKEEGHLVYSTCSLEPEENEEVIEFALQNFPVELVSINLSRGQMGLTEKTKKCKRFWPDTENTQGFFIAKLKLIAKK